MKMASKTRGLKSGRIIGAALNVQGNEDSTTESLEIALLLRLYVEAVQRCVVGKVSVEEPPKRKTTLSTSRGSIKVGLYPHRYGRWTAGLRNHVVETIEYNDEFTDFIAAVVSSGKILSKSRLERLTRLLAGDELTPKIITDVILLFKQAIRKLVVERVRVIARRDCDRILDFVHKFGIQKESVAITGKKPVVDLCIVARAARVSLLKVVYAGLWESLADDLNAEALGWKWTTESKIFIPTINNIHGRKTTPGITIDFEEMGVCRGGLLDDVLTNWVVPASHAELGRFVRNVRRVAIAGDCCSVITAEAARRILSLTVERLNEKVPTKLCEMLEECLESEEWGGRTQKEYVKSFYSTFKKYFDANGIRCLRYGPRVKGCILRVARPLISDTPDPFAIDELMRPSIMHVATGSLEEAKQKSIRHLDDRLQRISEACDKELSSFMLWKRFIKFCDSSVRTPARELVRKRVLGFEWTDDIRRVVDYGSVICAIGGLIDAMRDWNIYLESGFTDLRRAKRSLLFKGVVDSLAVEMPSVLTWFGGQKVLRYASAIEALWYVPRQVLLAIEIKTQIATGWNRKTVRDLTEAGICFQGSTVELQSVKTKTEAYQYSCIVDFADELLRYGLSLAVSNSRKISKNWTRESDSVFSSLVMVEGDAYRFSLSVDSRQLEKMIKQYCLPRFTQEQLRNQSVVRDFLETDDPYQVQACMGHEDLATTTVYLRQSITRVLNSANISHFQRQLAATIVWALDGVEEFDARGFCRGDVFPGLLFPVGDNDLGGESRSPLCDMWLNNREASLKIDYLRISHVARQRRYYAENWQRLRAEAPEKFIRVHLPRIEFTVALYAVISDSPFATLLELPIYERK